MTQMFKFRGMALVNAVHYNKDTPGKEFNNFNLYEVLEFTGKHPSWDQWFKDFDEYEKFVKTDNYKFKIIKNNGELYAYPGDWILRDEYGEIHVVPGNVFHLRYEVTR
jgi:hypothetical protein